MKLIQQLTEFYGQTPTDPSEILKWIENAGRCCYKSEDRITEKSAPVFVGTMKHSGHTSVLEHSNLVFKIDILYIHYNDLLVLFKERMAFHQIELVGHYLYVNGNLNAWLQTLESLIGKNDVYTLGNIANTLIQKFPMLFPKDTACSNTHSNVTYVEDKDEIPKRLRKYSVKHITNRAMTHEIVRYRRDSAYSQESQRYCGYDQIKFMKSITFIVPIFCRQILAGVRGQDDVELNKEIDLTWLGAMEFAEKVYFKMRDEGCKPQQAREVLPNSTKTEIVVTRGSEAWKWYFHQRCNTAADPQQIDLATDCRSLFEGHGINHVLAGDGFE